MKFLTQDALLFCLHRSGKVNVLATQRLVTIEGRKVLVKPDPLLKPITGCANFGPTIKPCTLTINVLDGYSEFIRINGRAVCLDTITGITDGTPPATVKYEVRDPGQDLVSEETA